MLGSCLRAVRRRFTWWRWDQLSGLLNMCFSVGVEVVFAYFVLSGFPPFVENPVQYVLCVGVSVAAIAIAVILLLVLWLGDPGVLAKGKPAAEPFNESGLATMAPTIRKSLQLDDPRVLGQAQRVAGQLKESQTVAQLEDAIEAARAARANGQATAGAAEPAEPPPSTSIVTQRDSRGGIALTDGSKWCTTCLCWRPPKASHCRGIGRCVEEYDHYCPAIGNAVGGKNHFLFATGISLCAALLVHGAIVCIYHVTLLFLRSVDAIGWEAQLNVSPPTLFFLLVLHLLSKPILFLVFTVGGATVFLGIPWLVVQVVRLPSLLRSLPSTCRTVPRRCAGFLSPPLRQWLGIDWLLRCLGRSSNDDDDDDDDGERGTDVELGDGGGQHDHGPENKCQKWDRNHRPHGDENTGGGDDEITCAVIREADSRVAHRGTGARVDVWVRGVCRHKYFQVAAGVLAPLTTIFLVVWYAGSVLEYCHRLFHVAVAHRYKDLRPGANPEGTVEDVSESLGVEHWSWGWTCLMLFLGWLAFLLVQHCLSMVTTGVAGTGAMGGFVGGIASGNPVAAVVGGLCQACMGGSVTMAGASPLMSGITILIEGIVWGATWLIVLPRWYYLDPSGQYNHAPGTVYYDQPADGPGVLFVGIIGMALAAFMVPFSMHHWRLVARGETTKSMQSKERRPRATVHRRRAQGTGTPSVSLSMTSTLQAPAELPAEP